MRAKRAMEEAERIQRRRERMEAEKNVPIIPYLSYFFSKESNKNYTKQEKCKWLKNKED